MTDKLIHKIKSSGIDLYVEERGSRDNPAVVFVHGYTTNSQFWRAQANHLSSTYHTIVFDLRGHGRSGKPNDAKYDIPAFVDDLFAVTSYFDLKYFNLAGLSMGGAVALQAVLDYPERINKLIISNSTAHGLGSDVNPDRVLSNIRNNGVVAASLAVIEASFAACTSENLVSWASEQVAMVPENVACSAILSLGAFDVTNKLSTIRQPTLIITGEHDLITPRHLSVAMVNQIALSSLVTIPASAHFPMLEQPEILSHVIESFLDIWK